MLVPDDDEVTVLLVRDVGAGLPARVVGVDLELEPGGRAGGVEAAGKDAEGADVPVALPGDDEVAVGIQGHGRNGLAERDVCVDLELRAESGARGGETLGENAFVGASGEVQATTKSPSASIPTEGHSCSPPVVVLTLNSEARGVPAESKRRAKTPKGSKLPGPYQKTTKSPSACAARATVFCEPRCSC